MKRHSFWHGEDDKRGQVFVDIPDDATEEQIKEIEQICISAIEDVQAGNGRDIDLSY